jgi:hypothetical protein
MLIREIITETISAEDIETIGSMKDIAQAKDAALNLMFANARSPERRADLRQAVRQAGRVSDLVTQLWSMKLSNEGLPTGIKTVKRKKGIVYEKSVD